MKQTLILIWLFMLSGSLLSQSSQEAIDYLDHLSSGQKDISEQLMQYISVSTHSNNARKIESKRQKLLKVTNKYRENVASATDFYGDVSLRNAMKNYYDLCYNSLANDYRDILLLKDKASSDYEVMKLMLEAEELAAKKFDDAHAKVQVEINDFASDYDINLVQGEKDAVSQMIEKSNEVTSYYNQVFLPMFKVNIQNIRLKEVLQSNDIDEIESQKQLIHKYAEEARKVLSQLNGFEGDFSLLESAKKRVDFYEEEATIMAKASIDYINISKQVALKEQRLNAVKPQKRTKEMVDEYNELIPKINQMADELNRHVDQFNQLSLLEMSQWQQIVEAFRKRHIPKYGLYEQET